MGEFFQRLTPQTKVLMPGPHSLVLRCACGGARCFGSLHDSRAIGSPPFNKSSGESHIQVELLRSSVFPSNVNALFRGVEGMCRWGSDFPPTEHDLLQGVARFCRRLRKMATLDTSLAPTPRIFCDREAECHWPITRPLKGSGHVCIGPARYKSLYLEEFATPKRSDYALAKTGGGWHRSASRQVYNPTPYKTDKSLYSVEFSRVKVPRQSDFQPLQKRVDPWLLKFPEEPKKKKDRCGIEVERHGLDGPPDFEDTLNARGRCCHGDHKRFVSKAENPVRYPYSLFDPAFVDHNRHLTPPKIPEKPYPKRVTEEDLRNNPPSGWKGTKGFFTPEPGGHSSESGVRAAGEYYKLFRPLEGTLLAMNANRSIKSRFMM